MTKPSIALRLSLLIVLCCLIPPLKGQEQRAHWVEVTIADDGVYKLSYSLLREMGFEQPERVCLLGRGGALRSEYLSPGELAPLGRQQVLHSGEALYFYGQSTRAWVYDAQKNFYRPINNYYTQSAKYILTDALERLDSPLEIVANRPARAHELPHRVEVAIYEQELYSLAESGRLLVGESFSGRNTLEFAMDVPSGAERVQALYAWSGLSKSSDLQLSLELSGQELAQSTLTQQSYREKAWVGESSLKGLYREEFSKDVTLAEGGESYRLSLKLNRRDHSSHLDYLALNYKVPSSSRLKGATLLRPSGRLDEGESYFLPIQAEKASIAFQVDQYSGAILRHALVAAGEVAYLPFQSNYQQWAVSPLVELHEISSYKEIALSRDPFGEHLPDLVILTTEALRAEAERLASFHRLNEGVEVLVITQEEVFRLFNGGTRDATAVRYMLAYLEQERSRLNQPRGLQLLLLFGDASADNRLLTSQWQGSNLSEVDLLPSYQSWNSFDIDSYTSDDYFALTTLTQKRPQGYSFFRPIALEKQPIQWGVGRIPVRTALEAGKVVDKIIRYTTEHNAVPERRSALFVADNGDANSHARQSGEVSQILERLAPQINVQKLYLASYPRVNLGGKTTVPEARTLLFEKLNKGLGLINYTGHGSPVSWADEQLLTMADIRAFRYKQLPLWITATCDFGGFDAFNTSAGEELLLHPSSGGIALLTTSRIVWDIPNLELNKAAMRQLFTLDLSGKVRPLGEVIREAKNSLVGSSYPSNRLNFVLLGDPLLRLRIPPQALRLKTIAAQALSVEKTIDVHALERVQIVGEVVAEDGSRDTSFEGMLYAVIYDGSIEKRTVDNFSKRVGEDVPPYHYEEYTDVIYAGEVRVQSGQYTLDLVVPRDVQYSGSPCKISLYAYDAARSEEAIGVDFSLRIVPGKAKDQAEDQTGPNIRKISLAGVPLSEGITVHSSPLFYAELYDPSSINLSSSSLGHALSLVIDNAPEKSYVLTDYYQPSTLAYGAGSVAFTLPPLEEGSHHLRFTAWDVVGNKTIWEGQFFVRKSLTPRALSLEAYPNPVRVGESLKLRGQTDLKGGRYLAKLRLYDLSGQLLGEDTQELLLDSPDGSFLLSWDLGGLSLPEGYYLVALLLKGESSDGEQCTIPLIVNNKD